MVFRLAIICIKNQPIGHLNFLFREVHADVSLQVNGAPNGNGPGGCNLKSGTAQSLNSDGLVSTRIGAIMARYGPSMYLIPGSFSPSDLRLLEPAPTNSCPAQNLQTVTDFNGVNYVIACGYNSLFYLDYAIFLTSSIETIRMESELLRCKPTTASTNALTSVIPTPPLLRLQSATPFSGLELVLTV